MNKQIRFFTVNVLIGAIVTLAIAGALIAVSRLQTRDKETSGRKDAFTYDLKNLRKTDPKFILYEEGAPIQTGFQKVLGIALGPNDAIYVHLYRRRPAHRCVWQRHKHAVGVEAKQRPPMFDGNRGWDGLCRAERPCGGL